MGGFGGIIADAGKEIGSQIFDGFGKFISDEGGAYGFARSGEALLRKSKAGNILADYLKFDFEQGVKRTGQQMLKTKLQPNMAPPQMQRVLRTMGRDAFNMNRSIYFGKNDEFIIKAIAAAHKERGLAYSNAMADVMSVYLRDASSYWRVKKIVMAPGLKLSLADLGIRKTAQYVAPKDFEEGLRNSTSWMFTQLIAFPHLSQIMNPMLREGIGNTAKALSEWTNALVKMGRPDKAFQDVIDSGILFDEFRYQAIADAKSPGASLATKLLNHPGFNWVRRQQITIAALAGKHSLLNSVAELKNGIDVQLNESVIRRLGVDLNALKQRGYQVADEDIQRAMHQAGVQNMFVRSELETPWRWDESFPSRLGAQYKQFGFRQSKFLAETFRDSYKYGGFKGLAKTTAAFAMLFPVAGEFVWQLEDIVKGKGLHNPFENPDGAFGEWAEAMGHAAGWGIFSSMFRTGQRGYIRGSFEGPLLGTLEDFIQAGADIKKGLIYEYEDEPDKATRKFKAAGRLTVGKVGLPGRIISNTLLKEDK